MRNTSTSRDAHGVSLSSHVETLEPRMMLSAGDPAVMLSVGKSIADNIEQDQADVFAFKAVSHTRYVFKTKLLTLDDSVLRLLDGTTELAKDDDGGAGAASRIMWTAPKTGWYFLEVSGAEAESEGDYVISAAKAPLKRGQARWIDTRNAVRGTIDQADDVERWRFRTAPGQRYVFSTELSGLEDSILRIIDRDGVTKLTFDDDGGGGQASHIEWTAPARGVYYVEVAGADSSRRGAFSLKMELATTVQPDDADDGGVAATLTGGDLRKHPGLASIFARSRRGLAELLS